MTVEKDPPGRGEAAIGNDYLEEVFGLQGRVALVTGARQGIGAAVALALTRAGARVALAARKEADLAATAAAIAGHGGDSMSIGFDLRDGPSRVGAVEAVVRHFGRLDVLINNAGVTLRRPALDYRPGEWEGVLQTNLDSAFALSCEAARHMLGGEGGRIVNVSSMYAHAAYPGRAAYIASKAGLEGMTRALAVEWGKHRITVNAVAPGSTSTPSREAVQQDPGFRLGRLQRTPLARMAEPWEMAATVLFLVGPGGAFLTGQTLVVDGGFSVA